MKTGTNGDEYFINYDLIQSFDFSAFDSKAPYPWHDFNHFLTPEAFEELHATFPDISIFEKQVGYYRGKQKPHDRYLLSYEDSVYHQAGYQGRGVVHHQQLPKPWRQFIRELESRKYKNFIASVLKTSKFKFRYEWHLGFKGSQISPHVDVHWRIGNHMFYFNTREDWNPKWGGSTLVLGGNRKYSKEKSYDFSDFKSVILVKNEAHHSLLIKNTNRAWHGVKSLRCPDGKYRRMFMIIFVPQNFKADVWINNSLSLVLHRRQELLKGSR